MGLLHSIQNSLIKQSSVGQQLKQQKEIEQQVQQRSLQGLPFNNSPLNGIVPIGSVNPLAGMNAVQKMASQNPFLLNANGENRSRNGKFMGQNNPLNEAMFIGYHNEKPIYGGSQLFVLA